MKFVLLTGFALGPLVLQPLKNELENLGHEINILALPQTEPISLFLKQQEKVAQSIFLGWSLGGQIATLLAQCWQRPLVTIGSNPCFSTKEDWSSAMPRKEFIGFCQQYQENAQATLKRFYLLVSKGDNNNRKILKNAQLMPIYNADLDLINRYHLSLLGSLDTRESIQQLNTPQLHFFADNDALVPKEVAKILQLSLSQVSIKLIQNSSHLLPYTHASQLAEQIHSWVQCQTSMK